MYLVSIGIVSILVLSCGAITQYELYSCTLHMQCSMCRYLGDSLGSLARSRHHHHCHRSGREPRHIVISSVISTSSYHPSYPSLRNYFDCQINVTQIILPETECTDSNPFPGFESGDIPDTTLREFPTYQD